MFNGVFDSNDRRVRQWDLPKMKVSDFQPGDAVYYQGDKLKQELTSKEGKPYKGWIHALVQNQDDTFVVWFPDTKESDSYIMKASSLSKARPPKVEKVEGVEVMPIRKRKSED